MIGERRRSHRVKLTIPLRIQGLSDGQPFSCEARTIDLNKHGARIQISRVLRGGEMLRITNLANRREATFRVAGPVSPPTPEGGVYGVLGPVASDTPKDHAYGVECLDAKSNFWGILFPDVEEDDGTADSRALLQCRNCRTVSLLGLSLIEVEVLETTGILSWPCKTCGQVTTWGYAEKDPQPVADPAVSQLGQAPSDLNFRKHRRVALQLPILIRRYSGLVEITKTEDVSKGGFCFTSDQHYHVGERLKVACPYNPSGQNIEVEAEVVRQKETIGSPRKVYGARYLPQPTPARR